MMPATTTNIAASDSRPTSKDGAKRNLWSSMLDGVASAKRLPEKNLLVLGQCCSFHSPRANCDIREQMG